MKEKSRPAKKDSTEEIGALVQNLETTHRRLQELTVGQVDAVIHPGGHAYLLHKAQEKLQKSETVQRHLAETMTAILNALPAHIALLDAHGVIVAVNDIWRQFATANELQGPQFAVEQNYLAICESATGHGSEEAHQAAAGIRAVLAGTAPQFSLEYPCHSPTDPRWFLLLVTPMREGLPAGAVVMHINITERKQAEESVRLSEERFRSMFTAAATGIAVSTPQGRFLEANAAYCRMLGYTEDEMRGLNFAALTHPDDLNLNLKLRDEVLAGQRESFVMEKRYLKKNGDIVWTRHSVSASRKSDGEIEKFVVVAEDITERKLAEVQLNWKTAFFEAQVHSALDGIMVVDSEGKIILQNQRLIDLWGLPDAFAPGVQSPQRLELVTSQVKNPQQFIEKIERLYDHPDEISRDEIELNNGTFLDRYSAPVLGHDGKHYGRIWSFRDITKRKRAELRLVRLNRFHMVLSKVSEAVLRMEDRQALFDAVCRIVVEVGAFRMGFIAEVDREAKVARAVASHGEGWEYLNETTSVIPTDGGPLSQGTVGTALRTGNPDVCNDIAGAARMKPWHKAAKKFGLLANASFPLKLRGETIGALVVYAGQTNFINEDEMRLMASVGNDISFALESLEKEKERHLAQVALQRRQSELQVLFDLMPAMIWFKDTQNGILRVNQRAAETTGLSATALEGKSMRDLYPKEADKYYADDLEVIQSRAPKLGIIEKLKGPEDRELWVRTDKVPVCDKDGTVMGIVVMVQDITERKRAEESLALFRTLVDGSPDSIEVIDPETGRFLDVNTTGCARLGYTREEMLALNLADIDVEKDYRILWPAIVEEIKKTGLRTIDGRHRRKDGSTFPVEVNARFINLDRGYMVAVVRDATERKRLEARFRRLVDSNAQGVFFWNTKGDITEANDAFLQLVRHTREDLEAGRINWMAMTPPEYADRDRKAMEECAASGVCQSYEKEFVLKDGSRVPVLLGAAMFEDNPGEGVCFILDLTERKKLEQQFLRAQRMESIGTLAGGIAHDLNNVLAPITMSIDLLKMKFTDKGSQELLATLGSSAQRGAEMVRQVLSFARGVEGRKMDVQVKHLLQDIEKIAVDTFPKNIQVRSIVPGELWTILGDPTQLHQVLLNFSVNARDAMPNGGILTISAENIHLDEHYAGLNPDANPGAYVFLQIADTGTGMPPNVIEKIFDPFFTTKEIGKGTGLGLSTSLAIVKSHGGFIRVYSEPGKGTTFKAYFPAQTEESTQTSEETTAELPRGNGELILVVDDEASVRLITRQTLEAFGYRVVLAADGAEAVAIVARQGAEIAVVLTDMMMPVMDGPATIQVLLRLNPKLPIIAASGLSADGRVTQAASLGVKHFLSKPSSADALLKVLRQILSAAPK